jgi:hypothetical protein
MVISPKGFVGGVVLGVVDGPALFGWSPPDGAAKFFASSRLLPKQPESDRRVRRPMVARTPFREMNFQ